MTTEMLSRVIHQQPTRTQPIPCSILGLATLGIIGVKPVRLNSDKGCQYTAVRFTQRLVDAGIAPSTGSVGDSFDNALAENLWSTLKIELIHWPATTFATRAEAQAALFRYIDGWYNPRRIQQGLDGRSPDEYEAAWHARRHQHRPATLQPEGAGSR